jgi:hypothetical protein
MARDRVTPDLHRRIVQRDGCLLARYDRTHECRDGFGNVHGPWSLERLTVEHVKDDLRMGQRAPSDEFHLVGLCAHANVSVPDKGFRAYAREYLAAKRAIAEKEAARAGHG